MHTGLSQSLLNGTRGKGPLLYKGLNHFKGYHLNPRNYYKYDPLHGNTNKLTCHPAKT